jgi:hypothetical protein
MAAPAPSAEPAVFNHLKFCAAAGRQASPITSDGRRAVFFFGSLSILRTANRKLVDLFSAGGWKLAVFLGTVFSLVALIYWVRKNSV